MTRLIPKLSMEERVAFVETARLLLKAGKAGGAVKFEHCGRSVKGIDCIGAPIWVYAQLGMAAFVQDLDRYERNPDGHTLREKLRMHLGEPRKRHQWRVADIALLRWYGKGNQWVNHVGILTPYIHDPSRFGLLHSYLGNRKVVEHIVDEVWKRRIVEVYPT